MKTKSRRLKFRIAVSPRRFLRVTVCDTREDMWKAIEATQGVRHQHEVACSIFYPGATDQGCVADLFFFQRGLRPGVIAHEAAHSAMNVCAILGEKAELANDEVFASWVEKIVDKIWVKAQTSPL